MMSLAASPSPHLSRLRRSILPSIVGGSPIHSVAFGSDLFVQSAGRGSGRRRLDSKRFPAPITAAMDEDFGAIPSFSEERDEFDGGDGSYVLSSSEDEFETDWLINATSDLDLPTTKDHLDPSSAVFTVTTHRFAALRTGGRKRSIRLGLLLNLGLVSSLAMILLFVDWCSWKIVRLPLEPFHLTHPFSISTVFSACAGWLFIPLVNSMKIHQILKRKRHIRQSSKRGIPTMGGLYFIPIGIAVALSMAGHHSIQVHGVVLATLAFGAIGLLDDILSHVKNHNYGLAGRINFLLQVLVGAWFSFWLDSANISTPYSMKLLVPLPPPLGLVYLGRFYSVLTVFCFITMGNGVNTTEGLDGLAGGATALAFIGMAVAVLPICPELAVFGASMAGTCIGFLFHNRYRASIYMGNTGSLALGGALAAMAACTGMFIPLFISCGIFVLEFSYVIIQVLFMKGSRNINKSARYLFGTAPLHYHLALYGLKEPVIVGSAYAVSCILALCAGYVGLISA